MYHTLPDSLSVYTYLSFGDFCLKHFLNFRVPAMYLHERFSARLIDANMNKKKKLCQHESRHGELK